MLLGLLIAMFVASRMHGFSQIFLASWQPIGLVIGAFVIFCVGLIDDVRNISAPAKVAGQVLAAMVLVFLGVTMYWFKIPFVSGIYALSPSVLPLVTAVWVVGMANAVNLIDGLDGLAAGIVAIASGALCVYGLQLVRLGDLATPDELGPLIAAICFGVCVGFLPHNFHPARVFMGDSGALMLGLLMAAATMIIGGRTSTVALGAYKKADAPGDTFFRFAPLFIPLFILGVPILDTAFAIVRRTVRRTSFAERDLGHLHHRLIRLGHGHRRAVLILWAWTAVLSAFALAPIFDSRANFIVPFAVAFLVVGLYTVFRPGGGNRPVPVAPTVGEVDAVPVGARREGEEARVGSGLRAGPVSVVMSAGAGVAVAGEPDLATPRRRRRGTRRVKRGERPRNSQSDMRVPQEAPPSGAGSFAGDDDQMRR
jgi:UDP-GlcNAc:undecaprenyl-phosphate GlcNAc-1-phosphate transferase